MLNVEGVGEVDFFLDFSEELLGGDGERFVLV